ncbi:hypothetical protein, partial [Sinorhizobium meliloti]|uniref:hypothetical protein n=1 Tax=Rhizobium meliloti TaxID=382 RepID=UPI001F1FD1CB
MLPSDPEAVRAAFLRWTRGDEAAADFLAEIAAIARLADDIVDEDENRQRNVCWLLVRTLTRLPQNPFFNRHLAVLAPVIHSVIVQWELSDEWRSSHDALKRQFGFVMREAVGSIVTGDCQEFCAVGRFHQLKNRSPKMTANCVFASTHS